ncbi:5134_t:CDS:2 [Acaulospora morrowiae]|uniref:5134_t:CDS:1 n=1 Tax=Acaulospora morrowiae TaxID=94023 RepID=A0A9N9B8K4_9GLOM|nr:5134_t:CDS:2 [Acaulospora morrowiae]
MKFGGYEIEILVEDKPLKEYYVPVSEGVVTATGPSYFFDAVTGEKLISSEVTYASVVRPNTRFAIKLVAQDANPENRILAEVYVDGKTDHRGKHIRNANPRKKEYFRSSDRTKNQQQSTSLNNSFRSIKNLELDEKEMKKLGGPGAVSVYFYRAECITKETVQSPQKYEQRFDKETELSDERRDMGTEGTSEYLYFTSFDEVVDSPLSKESRYATMNDFDLEPIAALHLHYRPESWILDQGFSAVGEKDKVPEYTEDCEDLETTWDDGSNKEMGDIEMVNGETNTYSMGIYPSGKFDPSGANIGNLDLHNNSKGTTKKFPKTSLKPSFSAPNNTDCSNPINKKNLPTYVKFTTITVTATSTTIDLSNSSNTMTDTNIIMDEDILDDSLVETNLADKFKHSVNIGGNKGNKENGDNRLGCDGKKVNSIGGQNRDLEEDQSEYDIVRSDDLEKSFGKDNKRKNGMNYNSSGKVCDTLNDDNRNTKRIKHYETNENAAENDERIDNFFIKRLYRIKENRKNGMAQNKSNEKQQEFQKEKTTSVGAISQAKQQTQVTSQYPYSQKKIESKEVMETSRKNQVSLETEETRREQQISQETETSHREQQVSQENSQKILQKQLNVKKSDVGLTKILQDEQRNPKDKQRFFSQRNLESGTSGIGNTNISQECPMNVFTQKTLESSGFDTNIQDKQQTMKDNEILYDCPTIDQSVNPSDNPSNFNYIVEHNRKRKHVEDISDISEGRYIKKEFKEVSVKKEVDFEEEMGNNMKANEKSGSRDISKRKFYAVNH